jgi:hypothetical protein
MATHYAMYRGSRITVVTQPDANGRHFARSVTVTRKTSDGAVVDTVPHQMLAFEHEKEATKEAIALAEAYLNSRP